MFNQISPDFRPISLCSSDCVIAFLIRQQIGGTIDMILHSYYRPPIHATFLPFCYFFGKTKKSALFCYFLLTFATFCYFSDLFLKFISLRIEFLQKFIFLSMNKIKFHLLSFIDIVDPIFIFFNVILHVRVRAFMCCWLYNSS